MFEVVAPVKEKFDKKTGGLYSNMNYAMCDAAENKKVPYVLFIQDDMQFVRTVSGDDLQSIETFFEINSRSVQFYPCFFKASIMKKMDQWHMDEAGTAYLKNLELSYSGFSAVGIFHVNRFLKEIGSLDGMERNIDNMTRRKGIQKGYAVYPFMMYLPFTISYRNRKRALMHKLSEFVSGAGFYPIQLMDSVQCKKLLERDPYLLPYAEMFLKIDGLNGIKKWSFAGGTSALYEQGGYKRFIGRVINRFK
ncbi:hypothetical protein [Natronogracilivirga saccharolytica]|nr:hypothetical protein [Natronogracilivirga saccharolytica]